MFLSPDYFTKHLFIKSISIFQFFFNDSLELLSYQVPNSTEPYVFFQTVIFQTPYQTPYLVKFLIQYLSKLRSKQTFKSHLKLFKWHSWTFYLLKIISKAILRRYYPFRNFSKGIFRCYCPFRNFSNGIFGQIPLEIFLSLYSYVL